MERYLLSATNAIWVSFSRMSRDFSSISSGTWPVIQKYGALSPRPTTLGTGRRISLKERCSREVVRKVIRGSSLGWGTRMEKWSRGMVWIAMGLVGLKGY